MLTTEDEARKRWCPHNRTLIPIMQDTVLGKQPDEIASCNRKTDGTPIGSCIASACMAWRWSKMIERTVIDQVEREMGYCGLAGRP